MLANANSAERLDRLHSSNAFRGLPQFALGLRSFSGGHFFTRAMTKTAIFRFA
jgi:hypothetical protein